MPSLSMLPLLMLVIGIVIMLGELWLAAVGSTPRRPVTQYPMVWYLGALAAHVILT